jgi:hypothetical protein
VRTQPYAPSHPSEAEGLAHTLSRMLPHHCFRFKVLLAIVRSPACPIATDPYFSERATRRTRLAAAAEHACVYVACTCKAEFDSGSDFKTRAYRKENFEQQTLGVFFSMRAATRCAKE